MSRTIKLVWLVLLFPALAPAADIASDVDERLAGRVFAILADYQIAIGELDGQRYAYLIRGEMTSIVVDDNILINPWMQKVSTSPFYRLTVFDGPTVFTASAGITSTRSARYGSRRLMQWDQEIRDGTKIYRRRELVGDRAIGYVYRPELDNIEHRRKQYRSLPIIHPVRQAFYSASIFASQTTPPRPVESTIKFSTLIKAHFDKHGDLIAEWHRAAEPPYIPYDLRIVFGKTFNFLPIEASKYRLRDGKRQLTGRLRTTWKKVQDHWVPATFEGISLAPDIEREFKVTCDYVIKDQLGQNVIQADSDLWLQPIARLFGGTAVASPFSVSFPEVPKQ